MTLPPSMDLREAPQNLLPLEEFRYIFGMNPFLFWQLSNDHVPVNSNCNGLVYEYNWQNADAAGRQQIRQAIFDAENLMRKYLNYSPAPHYVVEEILFPRYPDQRFENRGYASADGRWKTVQLSEGHIRAVGTETLTLIGSPAVVLSDRDSDGLYDTFTATIPTTVTDPDEIAVYFPAADRLDGQGAGEAYRINPVQVTISGGAATIRGRAWLLVKPVRYEGVSIDAIDPAVVTNFAATLDVCRRYTSAGIDFNTAQAVLIWETRPWPEWAQICTACPTASTDPAGIAFALARCGIRDAENGRVTIGESIYDTTAGTWSLARNYGYWCRPPDRAIVRYLAGIPLQSGRMDARFRTPVARLAAAEMARPICACETANRALYEWMFDLSRASGSNDEQYRTSDDMLTNPFGTRRGHVYAWRFVEDNMLVRGMTAG